jgi:hypothetical protein
MHQRALAATDLDPYCLLELLKRTDRVGVLSIFARAAGVVLLTGDAAELLEWRDAEPLYLAGDRAPPDRSMAWQIGELGEHDAPVTSRMADRPPRLSLEHGCATRDRAQIRREIASAEAVRRPPQWLLGHDEVISRALVKMAAQIVRAAARNEHPAQHRPERPRRSVKPDRCRDRRGHDVGLLGGEAALLDREGRRVARCKHVLGAMHAAVRIGRNESGWISGNPWEARPTKARQRDHAIEAHPPVAG